MHKYEPSTMWLSPQHFDRKQATIEQDWLRALRMRMSAPALQATSTPIAHGAGPRRPRAEGHLGWLACAYAKAGPGWRRAACGVQARSASTSTVHVRSQAARGWLPLGLLASPRPPRRALRPVAAARMHMPLPLWGRRHLRVALEIF